MKIFKITLTVISILLSTQMYGQNIDPNNLKNINVDKLSDAQIEAFVKNAQEKGMTQEQLETLAMSRGMPASEVQKLKMRIEKLDTKKTNGLKQENKGREFEFTPKDEDLFEGLNESKTKDTSMNATLERLFGYSMFNSKSLTFEPSLNIPTPKNYQIGPGDEMVINVWGASQQNYILAVNPEGKIDIQDLGPVYVNGLTIEKASEKIKQRLTSIYSGLTGSNPNTYVQISLGNLRSIKVNITGEANMPGTYTLPSLASVFNALYYAGGPGLNGSFRDIKLIRDNKEIAHIDLYEFLRSGKSSGNEMLQDQDVIFIPAFKIRVDLNGEVKHPGIFEMKENERFTDLVTYAGDFTDNAYVKNIKLIRNTEKERQVKDIAQEEWPHFSFKNGDILTVEPLLDRFSNRVEIKGAVYRQGMYELTDGLSLKDLIEKAEGLREDAFMDRAVLYRLLPNNKTQVISVDLNGLMDGDGPATDVMLQREDLITVYSIFDLEEKFDISIQGEIQSPGKYSYYQNIKLGDIIAISGGFKESASLAKIDVARRIKDKKSTTAGNEIADLFTFSVDENLSISDSAHQFRLQPYDVIFIRKSPGYEEQKFVSIQGEVSFPGSYSLMQKNDRISDLIKRSGGFTNEAYPEGAKLRRKFDAQDAERKKALDAIQKESADSIEIDVEFENVQSIGINLLKIMEMPGSKFDIFLKEDDVLEIPKQLQTVSLNGALLYPVSVRFDQNYGFRQYVDRAGGFSEDAKKRKAYVLYANGSVNRTKSFMGFVNYPRIEPGAEIIVPRKQEKQKMTVQEAVSLGSMVTSMSMAVLSALAIIMNN